MTPDRSLNATVCVLIRLLLSRSFSEKKEIVYLCIFSCDMQLLMPNLTNPVIISTSNFLLRVSYKNNLKNAEKHLVVFQPLRDEVISENTRLNSCLN